MNRQFCIGAWFAFVLGCTSTDRQPAQSDTGSTSELAEDDTSSTTEGGTPTSATSAGPGESSSGNESGSTTSDTETDGDPTPIDGIWLSPDEIAQLPMEGPAWENVLSRANLEVVAPNLNERNTDATTTVAKALVFARTGDVTYGDEVRAILQAVMGTEDGEDVLAVLRNTQGYVIAADLAKIAELDPELDDALRTWMEKLLHHEVAGACDSIVACHERRPNNFGTHAAASRIAIARYLDDDDELAAAATVFRGWLGDRSAYADFSYGELSWQCDERAPVGINPAGCTKEGHPLDGVLPDDQRRAGPLTWPPPKENYVWEALQGASVSAQLLQRAGLPAWEWEDAALLRAITWLHEHADYPAEGDDRWQPWLFNCAYGTQFPAETPASPGKGMGFTDWTHANCEN
jgi:hypothetical protein